MKIALVMPANAANRSGNRHTAARWRNFLRELGHRVRLCTEWSGGDADTMIALHARKSAPSILRFNRERPGYPLIVALTGTDLYRDIRESADAKRSLALATRLIVLQPQGRRELNPALRKKTRVVYQSADVRLVHKPCKSRFRVAVVGHLREEKDPFCAARALCHLDAATRVEIVHVGEALGTGMRVQAQAAIKREPRYRWLGGRPHGTAMHWLASSHVLVVSSVMEGGANVICEAARIGVPVLASRIAGNIGMLGGDYRGYFPLFDDKALARLVERCRCDDAFYAGLKDSISERRELFAPHAERAALAGILAGLRSRSTEAKQGQR